MATTPSIAIVTPAYNAARFLAATIDSVRAQDHPGIQHIVVDDGSTDSTSEVLTQVAETNADLRVIRQPNRGVSAARNLGVQHLSPTVRDVLFLDADDLLRPSAVSTLVRALHSRPEAVAAHGQSGRIDSTGTELPDIGWERADGRLAPTPPLRRWCSQSVTALDDAENTSFASLAYRNPITTPGQVLIRRDALEATQLFDPDRTAAEDWDLLIQLAVLGEIVHVAEVVLDYRRHEAAASVQLGPMRKGELSVRRRWMFDTTLTAEQRLAMRIGHRRYESVRMVERLRLARAAVPERRWSEAFADGVRAGSSAAHVVRSWLPPQLAKRLWSR